MKLLLAIAFCIALAFSVCFRVAVFHPVDTVRYAVKDFIKYIKYRRWNEIQTGSIIGYVGLFGKGKTLSSVHYVTSLYSRYHNKKVYDFNRKKWVTQDVNVLSNVELTGIPYTRLDSLQQIVDITDASKNEGSSDNVLKITLVLMDEASTQLNSREFKTNIDPLFLNTLLTCRHHHISLIYTAQRFQHVDALLRQVTAYVVSCNKVWRFMVHGKYDAWEMENATNVSLIKPMCRYGWFITDKDFNMYDTLACVSNLKKAVKKGDMISQKEILDNLAIAPPNMEGVVHPSRAYSRSQKKSQK